MKLNGVLFCSAILFFKIIAGAIQNQSSTNSPNSLDHDNPITSPSPPLKPVKPYTPQPPPLPPPPPPRKPDNGMVINKTPTPSGMSIEDIILSGINTNEKIEADIVNMITKYALNYNTFKAIHFTTNDYLFEKKIIEMELGEGEEVTYSNFKVNSSYKDDQTSLQFSTHIKCNSEGNTTVQVVLPDIEISFNASIKSKSPWSKPSHYGSIWIILENGTLTGLVETQPSNTTLNQVHSAEISNEMSKFELIIDSPYQTYVYNHLQEILLQIKHSLEKFFLTQLNLQMQNFINVTDGCSKGRLRQSNLNEIYIIMDTLSDSWNNLNLTVGPAIIEGLTHFNKVDFHIWDTSFQDFNNIICGNELSLQMISDSLSGKMRWNYSYPENSSEMLTYAFNMDYFEIKCNMKPTTSASPTGLNFVKTDVEINLGENRIVMSELNRSEQESNFVNVILSNHLENLIDKWFFISLIQNILPKVGYFDCYTGKPAQ